LLAIKIRQREGQTLEVIKGEIADLQGDQLEKRVASSLAPALGNGADTTVARDDDAPAVWRRLAVAEGIELHIRSDSVAAREGTMVAIRESVRAALGREDVR
jgi:hypothetical protein